MIKPDVRITVGRDRLPGVRDILKRINTTPILVGIPEEKAGKRGKITNAQLCYIHTHGVRSKRMQAEMDQMMMGANGVPHTLQYDRFLDNMAKGMPYRQALQLYMSQHGGKGDWRIPPRPIIEPAIEDPENKAAIVADLKVGAMAASDGDEVGVMNALKRTGMDAASRVRMWFVNPKNLWAPNSPRTVKRKGSDRPLIDTGQLRKSITYVIRNTGGGGP